jgi:hypothetical protein
MEELKRWADYVCMCAFCLTSSLSASEFQGAARLEAKVFTIMCETQEKEKVLAFFTIMCATQEKEKVLAFLLVKWRLGYHPRVDRKP